MLHHRVSGRVMCLGVMLGSALIVGTATAPAQAQSSANTRPYGAIADAYHGPVADTGHATPTPVADDDHHEAGDAHEATPTPVPHTDAPAPGADEHQNPTPTAQVPAGSHETPVPEHAEEPTDTHPPAAETDLHQEDDAAVPHGNEDAHATDDSHAEGDSHPADEGHGEGESHGKAIAPPDPTTKGIILGAFGTINLGVVVVAAVLKRRMPKRPSRGAK